MLTLFLSLLVGLLTLFLILYGLSILFQFLYYLTPDKIVYVSSNLLVVAPILDTIIGKYVSTNSNYATLLGKGSVAQIENVESLDTQSYHFVELGCGMAKVSRYVNQKYDWASVVGVEGEPIVLSFARLRNYFSKKKIRIIRENLFKVELPQRSIIYCYLTTSMMDKLYREGRLFGKLVVSLSFHITGVEPTEEFSVIGFQRRLLVYDFRKVLS
jgi:hypothetical protein